MILDLRFSSSKYPQVPTEDLAFNNLVYDFSFREDTNRTIELQILLTNQNINGLVLKDENAIVDASQTSGSNLSFYWVCERELRELCRN
jgi:hypothetical protein